MEMLPFRSVIFWKCHTLEMLLFENVTFWKCPFLEMSLSGNVTLEMSLWKCHVIASSAPAHLDPMDAACVDPNQFPGPLHEPEGHK